MIRIRDIRFVVDENATISLYISAAYDDEYGWAFDTQNDMILVLESSLGYYRLFPHESIPEFMRSGFVEYFAYTTLEGTLNVLVTVRHNAAYKVYNLVFCNDKTAFRIVPVFYAEGILPVGRG